MGENVSEFHGVATICESFFREIWCMKHSFLVNCKFSTVSYTVHIQWNPSIMTPLKRGYLTNDDTFFCPIGVHINCMCTLHSTVLVEALIFGICVCIYIHTVCTNGSNELRTPL